MMTMMRTLVATALLLTTTQGFKFMSKLKMPSLYDIQREEAIQQRFGDKKLVVVTGTSSGLGRKTALALLRTGDYHVIGAVRDVDKMAAVAQVDGFPLQDFTSMECEMNSFASVKNFCKEVDDFRMGKPLDRLICNAGVYQPSLDYPKWSQDGHEQTMQINYLSHFLMISKLLPSMMDSIDPRVTMVGSVTGNDNTVGGGGVYPIANLHQLDGFAQGFQNPVAMADGYSFNGAKSYKDSKLCLMMLANTLHTKFHKLTHISFSSIYPGCIAESPLFREKRSWFRAYFPVFMKFITGGFVGEEEAGQRLFQVAHDPRCSKSGVYWSWNGGPREGRGLEALEKGGQISGGGGAGGGWDSIFENDQSAKVLDFDLALKLFDYSTQITGAEWPDLQQVRSPCPTLNVIGGVQKYMIAREEMKRIRAARPGFHEDGTPIVVSSSSEVTTFRKTQAVADKVVGSVLKHSVGRVLRFLGRRLLGRIPDEAIQGSYDSTVVVDDETSQVGTKMTDMVMDTTQQVVSTPAETTATKDSISMVDEEQLQDEIAQQLFSNAAEDEETDDTTQDKQQLMKQA